MRNLASCTTAVLILLGSSRLLAQQPRAGRLEGNVEEKITTRAVSAASVLLVPAQSDSSVTYTAHPDGFGHFAIDSLPPGRYLIQISSPTLDSLDLAVSPSQVRIAAGETARFDHILPFGSTLRDMACPGVTLGVDKTVVAGRAVDADTDKPLVGADVVALWIEVALDKKTLKSTAMKRTATVKTGSTGEYRMCGVPASRFLSLQLQHSGRASAAVRLSVSSEEGVAVRDLSMSPTTAPTIAALDSLEAIVASDSGNKARTELQLTGTSSLNGSVRGSEGLPVSGVRVRVRDARSFDITDAAGRFSIAGLPSGTQMVLIQHLGYALAEIPVELRPGASLTRDLNLERVVSLDSIRVIARKPQLAEFENRRAHSAGRFMTATEIAARKITDTPKLIQQMGGFVVEGTGNDTKLISSLAIMENPTCRTEGANVIIDGRDGTVVNALAPVQIGGLEIYSSASLAPAKYADRATCGLIIMWTKQALGSSKAKQVPGSTLQYNGY